MSRKVTDVALMIAEMLAEAHALGYRRGAGDRQRARSGLAAEVISEELGKRPGMTTEELERCMRGIASLSKIREQLNQGAKQGRYRRERRRWYLAAAHHDVDPR